MKFLLLSLLLLVTLPLRAEPHGIDQSSELLTLPAGEKILRWHGHTGRSYFLQVSDPNDHLVKWTWAPVIEGGNDEEISYEVDGTADKGFFRLKYTNQLPGPGETFESADFDNDGISNINEISPPPPLFAAAATDPLDGDVDHDGLLDGFERAYGFDPNNSDEDGNNVLDGDDDGDLDGFSNAAEAAAGSNPTDPNSTPNNFDEENWFVAEGNHDNGGAPGTTSRCAQGGNSAPETHPRAVTCDKTITIKKGQSRLLVIGTRSLEWTDWESTRQDDTFEWNITPSSGGAITGASNVEARITDWDLDFINEVTLLDYGYNVPVHIETVRVLQAPANADMTVRVKLTVTNIGDGMLPSSMIAGLIPLRIEPDDNMSGVVGDMVDSNKGEGGEKHFVTPKSATAGDFVSLRTDNLEEAWITPGDPCQLVEWDPAVGESGDDVTKWKVKRDAAGKFPVKIRTLAKYGHEEAKKLNVWAVWATGVSSYDDFLIYQDGGTSSNINADWNFVWTLQPQTIFSDSDRPDLSGANTTPPPNPNKKHVDLGDTLAGGANKKWDVSRQARFKVINPHLYTKPQLPAVAGTYFDNQPVGIDIPEDFPSDPVEGNDDTMTDDEYRNPYSTTDLGTLRSIDKPAAPIKTSTGASNDTYEERYHFREFVRVEINGKWYLMSEYLPWRVHFKYKKLWFSNEKYIWYNNGSDQAADNNGF